MLTFFTLFSCAPARSELRVMTKTRTSWIVYADFNVALANFEQESQRPPPQVLAEAYACCAAGSIDRYCQPLFS
jgi:hypothetical protein